MIAVRNVIFVVLSCLAIETFAQSKPPLGKEVPDAIGMRAFARIEKQVAAELKGSEIEAVAASLRPPGDDASRVRVLLIRDHVKIRKQSLAQIVRICDLLLANALKREEASKKEGSGDSKAFVSELLYRKGRALGYMTLPDVVAEKPIDDPEKHLQTFEANWRKLSDRVNTLLPKYILLHIRRERLRGNLHEALRVLEIYAKKHPAPKWYPKKRQDMLYELGLVAKPFPKEKLKELLAE